MSEQTDHQENLDESREVNGIPDTWTDDQLRKWLDQPVDESRGITTENGHFRNDPTRAQRKPNDWDTSELEDFLHGELDGISSKRHHELINEYRRRESLEPAWSDREVLDVFRKGITPEQTSSGVWVNDRTRPGRSVQQWTDAELDAWTQGEIKAVGKATDNKLAAELRRRFSLETEDVTVDGTIKAYTQRNAVEDTQPTPKEEKPVEKPVEASAPTTGALTEMNLSFIDGVLDRYVEAVKPSSQVGEAEGGKAQRDLDNLFNYVLRLEGPALPEGLDMIKKRIVKEREGVFSPSNAYRFIHLLKGDRKAQQRHVNLIELFLIVTDRNAVAKRKQIDIRHMLSGFSPNVSDKLTDYFQNYA